MTTMRAPGETLGGKKSTNSPQIVFKCINTGLVSGLNLSILVGFALHWFVLVTMLEFTLEKVLTILDNETYQRINLELGIACNLVISSGVGDTVLIITLSIVIIVNTFSHVMSIGKYYTLTSL